MALISNLLPRSLLTGSLIRRVSIARHLSGSDATPTADDKLGGFAKAFQRHSAPPAAPPTENQTFASLLRNSKFVDVSI